MRIGFVGVGIMGQGIASNLLGAGHEVLTIAHRNRAPVEALVADGAIEATDLAQLGGESEIIFLCLSNSEVVTQVIDRLIDHLRAGHTIVDMTTKHPEASMQLEERLAGAGINYAEAPVTGGRADAEAGTLGALVGCARPSWENIHPIFEAFCASVQYFGPVGSASTAKLLNNYMVTGMTALVLEAFARAHRAGIDWAQFLDVVQRGSANSGVLNRIIPNALEGDFRGYAFSAENALKDIACYCDMKDYAEEASKLALATRAFFQSAVDSGQQDKFVSELLANMIKSS